MNKRSAFCVIIFSSLFICVTALAQNRPGADSQKNQTTCGPCATPEIKTIEIKPSMPDRSRYILLWPESETKTLKIKPFMLEGQRKNNSTSPVFQLFPQGPQARDKLKTPSEILKEFALPDKQKKNQ